AVAGKAEHGPLFSHGAAQRNDAINHVWTSGSRHDGRSIDLSQDSIRNAGPAYIRKAAKCPDDREVIHVPAYSHSDRWVGASGAWGGAGVGAGEIPGSQGICNLRCGTV